MSKRLSNSKGQFGTLPVFIASISTILGAILFLRFGYAVGNVGFFGSIGIIILGHAVTIPTALAVAEIATNRKVEGGGDYYVISRSFGINIGAAIGIALYLSQAISIAFYIIAFEEAFIPFGQYINSLYDLKYGYLLESRKAIGLTSMFLLSFLILYKGANIGVKALYVVASVIFISLIMFFIGPTNIDWNSVSLFDKIENSDNFFVVFTIIFPAFTGISAGLGLSGDLKDPKTSIPRGTLIATILGAIIYIFIALKLTLSASLQDLANTDELVMSKIAIWGPIIPIGLACAAVSSALGSILIAPRTLQA
jgi:amino acid transporter